MPPVASVPGRTRVANLHAYNHSHQEQWESDDGVHESDAETPHDKAHERTTR
jgi:hypothetical protein